MRNHTMIMMMSLSFLLFASEILHAEPGMEKRSATILNLQGEVQAKLGGKDWVPAEVGMVLFVQDQLKTSDTGFAEITLDNGETGTVEIDSGSEFKLAAMERDPVTKDKTTLLDLAVGRVLVHAQKLQGQSRFEVKTPTSTAGVRGTIFEVIAEE